MQITAVICVALQIAFFLTLGDGFCIYNRIVHDVYVEVLPKSARSFKQTIKAGEQECCHYSSSGCGDNNREGNLEMIVVGCPVAGTTHKVVNACGGCAVTIEYYEELLAPDAKARGERPEQGVRVRSELHIDGSNYFNKIDKCRDDNIPFTPVR